MSETPAEQNPGEPYRAPVYVEQRQPPIPLAAVLLAVGMASVLICMAAPLAATAKRMEAVEFVVVLLIGGVPGGILAMIMVLYSYNSWTTVALSYFAGSAASVAAVGMFSAQRSVWSALVGAVLLVLFGLVVRFMPRRKIDEPPTFEPIGRRPGP